jgi:hypothetical protein
MHIRMSPQYAVRQGYGDARSAFQSDTISTGRVGIVTVASHNRERDSLLAPGNQNTAHSWLYFGMACLVSLGLAGCGSRLTPVHGRVTYRGQPLADATVVFIPLHGQLANGVTDATGQFALKTGEQSGAAAGRYQITVTKYSQQASGSRAKREDIKKAKDYQGGKVLVPPKSDIPERYGDPKRSGLIVEVTGDPAQEPLEFALTD